MSSQNDSPAQEPAAWQFRRHDGKWFNCDRAPTPERIAEKPHLFRPLYAAPLAEQPTDSEAVRLLRALTIRARYNLQNGTGPLDFGVAVKNAEKFLDAIPLQRQSPAESEQMAKAALAYLIDHITYQDSYGVDGSDFTCCHLCHGGGAPGIAFKHDDTCPVLRCEAIGEEWWAENRELDKQLQSLSQPETITQHDVDAAYQKGSLDAIAGLHSTLEGLRSAIRDALAYVKRGMDELREARIDIPLDLHRAHQALSHAKEDGK
jgi:hypothetical protein